MTHSNNPSITNDTIRMKTRDIEHILNVYQKGKSIIEIAGELDFAQSYVQDVLLCAQTLAEEDAVAIAMLMEES